MGSLRTGGGQLGCFHSHWLPSPVLPSHTRAFITDQQVGSRSSKKKWKLKINWVEKKSPYKHSREEDPEWLEKSWIHLHHVLAEKPSGVTTAFQSSVSSLIKWELNETVFLRVLAWSASHGKVENGFINERSFDCRISGIREFHSIWTTVLTLMGLSSVSE